MSIFGDNGAFPAWLPDAGSEGDDGAFPVAGFGGGVAPQVVSAVQTTCGVIHIVFNEEMKNVSPATSDDVRNPANYTFTGPTTLTPTAVAVTVASPTEVDITINYPSGVTAGVNNYTVTVANVKSAAGLVVDPANNSASFNGLSCAPQASDFIAEILIGGTVVWSAINALPQQTLELDVSDYDDIYAIQFRIRGLA